MKDYGMRWSGPFGVKESAEYFGEQRSEQTRRVGYGLEVPVEYLACEYHKALTLLEQPVFTYVTLVKEVKK